MPARRIKTFKKERGQQVHREHRSKKGRQKLPREYFMKQEEKSKKNKKLRRLKPWIKRAQKLI